MEPVASACASAIDPLVFQCLKEGNGVKQIVKKHLVILVLNVLTKAHDYVSSHSQLTDLTSSPSWTLIRFNSLNSFLSLNFFLSLNSLSNIS
ncbi:unnamed protein product [Merluccius merluccius]